MRRVKLSPAARALINVLTWTVLLLVAWLDSDGCFTATIRGDVFGAIVGAVSWLVGVFDTVGAAVADSLVAAYLWLQAAVGWLGGQLIALFVNTGSMFAKVWEGLRIVWEDALKPALLWLQKLWDTVTGWLKKYLGPILKWANRVRDYLKGIYADVVKPILDALEIAHAFLKTLADLGVGWAAALDKYVQGIEHAITENWIRLTGWINELRDILTAVVTPDRLFQRLPFLTTLQRDVFYTWRVLANARTRAITSGERATLQRATETQSVPDLARDVAAFWNGEQNDVGAVVASLGDAGAAYWSTNT